MSDIDYIEMRYVKEKNKNIEKVFILISILTNIFGIIMVGVGYNTEKNACNLNFWYYLYVNVILNIISNGGQIVKNEDWKQLVYHGVYKLVFLIWGSILFSGSCNYYDTRNLYVSSLIYYVHDFLDYIIILLKVLSIYQEKGILNKDVILDVDEAEECGDGEVTLEL